MYAEIRTSQALENRLTNAIRCSNLGACSNTSALRYSRSMSAIGLTSKCFLDYRRCRNAAAIPHFLRSSLPKQLLRLRFGLLTLLLLVLGLSAQSLVETHRHHFLSHLHPLQAPRQSAGPRPLQTTASSQSSSLYRHLFSAPVLGAGLLVFSSGAW